MTLDQMTWPSAVFAVGVLFLTLVFVMFLINSFLENRKSKIDAEQAEGLRQLVRRYEQLSENTLDVQQRTAADLADLRTRTTSVEHILRTVD
jgi:F0F1-type ATP synthase membrane subunit b/b'